MNDIVLAAAQVARQWAAMPLPERAAKLEAVADALERERTELVELADTETHLGQARLNGELTRTTFQLGLFAEQVRAGAFLDVRIDRPNGQWPSGARPDLRRYRTGLGPVLVFAASNFPFAFSVAGGDTASALAAGCPVVVKAHPGHPRLSRRTAEIVQHALDLPGVFGLLEGDQEGVDALRHPKTRAAAFTGSVQGGLALARVAADRPEPIPFYGELGSVNPVVVSPKATARAEEIAKGYAGSLTQGAGQFCTNPGLLFVPEGTDLVEQVTRQLAEVNPAPMLNERIADGYRDGARRWDATNGVEKVVWPEDSDSLGPRLLRMDLDTFAETPDAAQECFGPLGVVVTYRRLSDLPQVVSDLPGQLTGSLHAQEEETDDVAELAQTLAERCGRVLWNEWPTGVAVTAAMQHGGPFPATTAPLTTSVGTAAIDRFLRPVAYQAWPHRLLPEPLRDDNPWNIPQHVDE